MRSDYLDTSNPLRLIAFFQFCDAANMARRGIADLKIDDQRLHRAAIAVFEATRQRAVQSAIDTLSGHSDFFAMLESNLGSD